MDLDSHRYDYGSYAVLAVSGELDLATVPRLRELLVRLVSDQPGEVAVVDLSGVTFCDSLGLGVLVGAQRRARAHHGELRLVVPDRRLADSLALAGLDVVLPRFANLDEATAT